MASPMTECKALLTQLSAGAPIADVAARVELVVQMLQRHSMDDLLRIAELLDASSKAQDKSAALVVARAEVEKLPVAAAEAPK